MERVMLVMLPCDVAFSPKFRQCQSTLGDSVVSDRLQIDNPVADAATRIG
jgi:hypothetical protein